MIKSVRVNMNDDGCEQKKRIGTNIIHGGIFVNLTS